MEKRKREKNGIDVFGDRVSRVGVGGVSGDGCQEISSEFPGNFLEFSRHFPGNFPESWMCLVSSKSYCVTTK